MTTLDSINQCTQPNCGVEVIVLINDSEQCETSIKLRNQKTLLDALKWKDEKTEKGFIDFHIVYEDKLPKKHAGVGLARKLAMDEAVRRFESIDNKDGLIVCLDADSVCDKNYLVAITDFFAK